MNNNKNKFNTTAPLLLMALLFPVTVSAQDSISETGVSLYWLWIALCAILVFFMQTGFMLLEGGMVRSKNTINVILKNFTDLGLGTIGFWTIGYGLMYGVNASGWFGTSGFMPIVTENSQSLQFLYSALFAATAATILSGAVAERFSYLPYVVGAFLVTTLVYPIFGSWAWGGHEGNYGWLKEMGFYDAAGASVVHSIGAWCALGALLVIGPRFGRYSRKGELHKISGHNMPFVAIGGFILWMGWFGFNGGVVNEDLSNLGMILVNTQFGAIGGLCGALLILAITREGYYITLLVNGALGGLVSITGGVNVLEPQAALITGLVAGFIVVLSSNALNKIGIDDVVGAIPVHGFCGAWGTLAVGLFFAGDIFNLERITIQLLGVMVAFIWGVGSGFCIFWALNKIVKIRVTTKIEQRGLDISEHKEIGYSDFMVTHARADK